MEPKEKRIELRKARYDSNSIALRPGSLVMYIDMNSYFASCEQQFRPELRGKPIGVTTYDSPHAAVIAPSIEAKRYGVKTGMRLSDCKALCPHIIPITTRPYLYRIVHVEIMKILQSYCNDVLAKSIDEAVINLSSYRLVYKDPIDLAKRIKNDIYSKYDYLKCSIGIAPNSFLAKLATELQKPDGLVQITPENIDTHLAGLKLTDLPGIAGRNERRLMMIGIGDPLQMRHASQALLRKAFGGIVGYYWHSRLNFSEVDLYSRTQTRAMSAMRTVSRAQAESKQTLESLLVSLCTRLEQRMVKQGLFCKEASFFIKYRSKTGWDTHICFAQPVQDALDLRKYILERIQEFEHTHNVSSMFSTQVQSMGVAIQNFMNDSALQYSLFDNRIQHDVVRKTIYQIKDKYGKNIVRKGSEMFNPHVMKDAIGFGSVKDMVSMEGDVINKYLLEEDY
ncbi:MAG: DNA polymerase Y family protein [Flavipsychrobacter sp.]